MHYFQYLNLPLLPESLIKDVYASLNNKNIFAIPEYKDYELYDTSNLVKIFTKSIFDFEHQTRVQRITKDLYIHKDVNRLIAYNYIIEQGGSNVETCFYNNRFELTEKYVIKEHRWHSLNVDVYHNVKNITGSRIALTVHIPLK